MIEYFTREEADKFAFYQIPKELTTNPNYKNEITNDAKFLYGVLRDRNQLSIKNNWIDDKGHVYIIFTREEAMEILNVAKPKAGNLFKELEKVELIEDVRQGLNKPNRIYVGKIQPSKQLESPEVTKSYFKKSQNLTSKSNKILPQEVRKSYPNNNDLNNTDLNNTEFNNNNRDPKNGSNGKSKNVVVSPDAEIVSERFQELYGADLNKKRTQELINEKGLEKLTRYLNNYSHYIQGREIKNLGADFYNCVMQEYSMPKGINNKKTPDYANFDQRQYEEKDFEMFYANLNPEIDANLNKTQQEIKPEIKSDVKEFGNDEFCEQIKESQQLYAEHLNNCKNETKKNLEKLESERSSIKNKIANLFQKF